MSLALLLSVVGVGYNNIINLWGPFHRGAYVPTNIAFAAGITTIAVWRLDLSRAELGLRADLGSAAIGAAAVAIFAVAAMAVARSRHGHRIADRRVAGLHGSRLVHHVLVRIPLGTAVTEEVVFRGVLVAAWLAAGHSPTIAATYASVAFGLWHISPTVIGVRMNDPGAPARKLAAAVVGGIVLTTGVGLALTWLRLETGSVIGPIILHAGVNSSAALAAVLADRRRRA